jgi:hypothetical protein
MTMLVSLAVAKARLKYDGADEDDDLELAIMGASEAVLTYLNLTEEEYEVASDGVAEEVPAVIVNAVLALVGIWKRDPSGVKMTDWEMGYLPAPVTAILYPLRDPAVG